MPAIKVGQKLNEQKRNHEINAIPANILLYYHNEV